MKFAKLTLIWTTLALSSPIIMLAGCANPYDKDACEGGRYHPPYYGTYPDSPYYQNDYYANFQREHFGRSDHRYDHTYGPNQVYVPSENP
jgi:hypothetical protein